MRYYEFKKVVGSITDFILFCLILSKKKEAFDLFYFLIVSCEKFMPISMNPHELPNLTDS
jgi:hypothetical protein